MAFSLFRKVREAQSAAAEAKQAAAKYEVGDPVVLSLTTKRKISWKAPALKHKTARINGTITSRMLKNKKWLYVVQNFNGYYIAGWKRERDLSPYDVERVDFWPDLSPSNKSSPRLKSSAAIPESAKPLTLFPAELPGSAEIPVLKDRKYERHKSSRFARDSLDSAGQPPTLDSAALTLPDVSELLDLPELPGSAEIPVLKDRKYERHKPRGLASPSQEWPADTRDRAPVGSKKSPLATASLAGPFTPVYPLVDATQNAELKLSPSADNKHVYPDMLEAIRKEMIPALDSSERQTAIFHVRWSLPEYCEKELESHEQLASVLTVTGTAGLAYATTCKEYLNRFWPQSELPLFLEMPLLLEAIVSNRNLHGRKRKKRFNLWRTSSRFLHWSTEDGREYEPEDEVTMHVLGSREYLIEVAQQLAWFSAVCRVPNHGKLTYSDVVFETVKSREFRLYTIGLQPIREEEYSCWHPMFVGSVIARGFPIPERRKEIGIELPFEVMISLGQILYPVEYEDGVILKGYSTILVPTNQGPDSVQWHFIRTNDRRKRIPMDSIIQYCPTHFETVDFTFLAGARTFVGYCRKAEIHLGTQGSGYEKIERSTARPEGTRMELSREISASLGSSGMGYFGGSITPKIIIAKGLLGTTRSDAAYLEDRLLNSKEQSIILYDVEKKRGWLVPELSVVLHIAHAWATRQHDSQELLNKIPHAEISGDGGEAAYAAIMRNNTLQLRSISANGEPLAFMDLMKNILNALESRKELIISRRTSFIHPWRRSFLRGWEFTDIVNCTFLWKRKQVSIDKNTGGEWYSIPIKNIETVVLFCRGLGEPIRPEQTEPACASWTPIPEGNCYLTASVPCIMHLSKSYNEGPSSPAMAPNLFWHRPPGSLLFENCRFDQDRGCNRLQGVVGKNPNHPGSIEEYGAVIFGRARSSTQPPCKPLPRNNRTDNDEPHLPRHHEQLPLRPVSINIEGNGRWTKVVQARMKTNI